MRHAICLLTLALACLTSQCGHAAETTVTKVVDTFDTHAWILDPYNKAPGKVQCVESGAPDTDRKGCMQATVHFQGDGFAWFAVTPTAPLYIPGKVKSIKLRVRANDSRFGLSLTFADGWGRSKVGKQDLKLSIPADKSGHWKTVTLKIPEDWVKPVRLTSISTHNWSAKQDRTTFTFWIDQLEVTTDISQVDPKTGALAGWRPEPKPKDPKRALKKVPLTPLVSVSLATGEQSNIFAGAAPKATASIRNWTAAMLTGKAVCRVLDFAGKPLQTVTKDLQVESQANIDLPLAVKTYGCFHLEAKVTLSDGTERAERLTFAKFPPYRKLTQAQKVASPYGINVHGGRGNSVLAFRRAGIIWFRDYAFSFDWMKRARGPNRKYDGWPGYPSLVKRYEDAGVMLLACQKGGIKRPEIKDGKIQGHLGPDQAWIQERANQILAFPQIKYWEIDNEYDLNAENCKAEFLVNWKNYGLYHRKYGEIARLLGNGEIKAVENGRAGVWPERLKPLIESGAFDTIDIVNVHHYCGVEPPEVNFGNFNTGFSEDHRAQPPRLFFDNLRATKRVAISDGKPRESWLTEFGWDTLAGHVVSPYEQAAYLPRAYLMGLASGTDKLFWFFDYDSPNPNNFFDGCGLLDPKHEPKLALAAMAGMTYLLPTPKYVGSCNMGPNTWGYVFEQDKKLVAGLWTLKGDNGPEVTVAADQLYDYFGNKLSGKSANLRLAPTYAVGLKTSDPLFKQTAYSMDSDYLVLTTAGDTVTPVLEVRNNRETDILCTIEMQVSKGWTAIKDAVELTVPKGKRELVEMPYTVNPEEPLGENRVRFKISEGAPLKTIVHRVLVQPPTIMQVGPIRTRPGKAEIEVKVGNKTAKPIDGTLKLQLPKSWSAAKTEIPVVGLKPNEIRTMKCAFTWNTGWQLGEEAAVAFVSGKRGTIRQPIIPNTLRLQRAKGIKLDADLADWPKAAEIPTWMMGCDMGKPETRVFLAWSPEGLYCGVQVKDAKVLASDPRSFWNGDCMEIFVDTADDKRHRFYEPGDHQFWFVPQIEENRVYAGQWKRKQEIKATRYDIPDVKSAAKKTADGYCMEFILPAKAMTKYAPAAGKRLGLCVNLTAYGKRFKRQVYWPRIKDWAVQNLPKTWGTMELVE